VARKFYLACWAFASSIKVNQSQGWGAKLWAIEPTNSMVARLPKGCWTLEPAYAENSGRRSFLVRGEAPLVYGNRVIAGVYSRLAPAAKTAGATPGDFPIFLKCRRRLVALRRAIAVTEFLWRLVMSKFALKVRQFLVSEDGPTAVEYAVMLALIVIVCLAAIGSIGTNAKTTFTNVANSLGSGS
jgi:pilus assembly protein Flp/PilA